MALDLCIAIITTTTTTTHHRQEMADHGYVCTYVHTYIQRLARFFTDCKRAGRANKVRCVQYTTRVTAKVMYDVDGRVTKCITVIWMYTHRRYFLSSVSQSYPIVSHCIYTIVAHVHVSISTCLYTHHVSIHYGCEVYVRQKKCGLKLVSGFAIYGNLFFYLIRLMVGN